MPVGTETRRGRSESDSFDSARFIDSLSSEVSEDRPHWEEITKLPEAAYQALRVEREEATKDKRDALEKARAEVDDIHANLAPDLRDKLKGALYEKSLKSAEDAARKNGEDVATARDLARNELNDKKVDRLINRADLDQVYARLKDLDPKKLREVIEEIADDLPDYKFDNPMINAADVLQADLENRFADLAKKRQERSSAKNEVEGSFLQKSKDATKQFIQARKGIDEARRDGKSAAVDITAMVGNIEGTYQAAKEMDKQVQRGPLVSQRKFWDPETKTHIIEMVYRSMQGEGTAKKINNKEVIVEYWNASKKDGGEMIRATYVRSGEKKEVGRKLHLKLWKSFKPEEQEVYPLKGRKNILSRYDWDLSDSARSQISALSSEAINASKRTEAKHEGLTKRRATSAKLNGRMMGTMGVSEGDARRASRLGKNRGVSFMQDLITRMFKNSKNISKK